MYLQQSSLKQEKKFLFTFLLLPDCLICYKNSLCVHLKILIKKVQILEALKPKRCLCVYRNQCLVGYNQQIIEFSNGNPNEFWHCPLLHRSSYDLKTQILGSTRPITILDVLLCRQLLVFITHYTHNYMANFRPFIWWWLAFRSQNHQKSSYIYYRYNVIHSKIKNKKKPSIQGSCRLFAQ